MLLLSTTSLNGYGLHRIFDFAKRANYDGIELVLDKRNFDNWDKEYVKGLEEKYKLKVLSIRAPGKGMNEKMVDRIVDLAINLGTQNVTFTPPYFREKNLNWYLRYLSKVKRDTHLSLSIKNVEPKFILWFIPEHKDANFVQIKRITGDTTLDIASVDNSSGYDILKAQKVLGNSIKNVYFSDTHGPKKHILPGQAGGGTSYLPLESFLMKLKATAYNGFITLDVLPRALGVGNSEIVDQNLKYFRNYYQKHFVK